LRIDEIFSFIKIEAAVGDQPDAALAVGLGGRAAGGPHLDPPLAVGVVGRFSKLIMFFR